MADLNDIFAKIFKLGTNQIQDELKMTDLDAWDSLTHMQLIAEIEKQFQIELTAEQIVAMTQVSKIKEILSC